MNMDPDVAAFALFKTECQSVFVALDFIFERDDDFGSGDGKMKHPFVGYKTEESKTNRQHHNSAAAAFDLSDLEMNLSTYGKSTEKCYICEYAQDQHSETFDGNS